MILFPKIVFAFKANPGLNGLIFGVLFVGIVYGIRNVARLFRERRWVNALPRGEAASVKPPILLAPMATLLGDKPPTSTMSTVTLRVILDSIGTRLDEAREVSRYLTGLLIFLGLLGTFWGLIETVGSLSGVLKSMQGGADAGSMFDDLKTNLSGGPLAGMSVSFTSSLFGLSGSLILGFLDLQAGQAQNRFYTELEDALTTYTSTEPHYAGLSGSPGPPLGAGETVQRSEPAACQFSRHGQPRRRHPVPCAAHARRAAADPRLGGSPGRAERRDQEPASPPGRRAGAALMESN